MKTPRRKIKTKDLKDGAIYDSLTVDWAATSLGV
jgi:hypothetical protein